MAKHLLITITLLFNFIVEAQEKYITRNGIVNFEASVASFEEIKAKNTNTSALLKISSGDFASLTLIKGFSFKIALMEEHFNENYIESDKFPKATFKGKILNFNIKNLNKNYQKTKISGVLNIHGVSNKIETDAIIKLDVKDILIEGEFKINLSDYNIKIPSIVKNKIAKEVFIRFNFKMKPQ